MQTLIFELEAKIMNEFELDCAAGNRNSLLDWIST